jgi:hypothetical protein
MFEFAARLDSALTDAIRAPRETRSFAEPRANAREEHARMLGIAAARRLRAQERAGCDRGEDAEYWKQVAPVPLTKAAALRNDPDFAALP